MQAALEHSSLLKRLALGIAVIGLFLGLAAAAVAVTDFIERRRFPVEVGTWVAEPYEHKLMQNRPENPNLRCIEKPPDAKRVIWLSCASLARGAVVDLAGDGDWVKVVKNGKTNDIIEVTRLR